MIEQQVKSLKNNKTLEAPLISNELFKSILKFAEAIRDLGELLKI